MSDPMAAQQALWDAIHGGRAADGAAHFQSDARLDAAGRMQIYADMYETRLLEAMQHDFPWTAQLIGDAAFVEVVRAYVHAHPLRAFTLREVGAHFPEFLTMQNLRADVAEVARLERMRGAVSIAADTEVLAVEVLGRYGPNIVEMRCVFSPTMQHVAAVHDVCGVIDALVATRMPPEVVAQACELVAWRRDDQVFHTALGGPAAEALRAASAGESIAAVCDVFAACPQPAQAAFAALGAWFSDGWVQHLV